MCHIKQNRLRRQRSWRQDFSYTPFQDRSYKLLSISINLGIPHCACSHKNVQGKDIQPEKFY